MSARVFVLDDDESFAKLLEANLGHAGDFRIRTFTDPAGCLEAITADPPDALVTDLEMPGMTGIEVTRRVRSVAEDLPVFVITENDHPDSAQGALDAGADELLKKPVDAAQLVLRIRKLVEALSTARATPGRRRRSGYSIPAGLTLRDAEREYIRHTLQSTGGKIQEAADILGISRKNLWEKRKRHGLL